MHVCTNRSLNHDCSNTKSATPMCMYVYMDLYTCIHWQDSVTHTHVCGRARACVCMHVCMEKVLWHMCHWVRMHACMHLYRHIHMYSWSRYMYTWTRSCVCMYVCMYVCLCMYTWAKSCVCMYVCMCMHIYMDKVTWPVYALRVCIYPCIYTYDTCICLYVCIHVFMYTHGLHNPRVS